MAYKQLSPIIVGEGGTGATTLTDHGVLLGSGTGAITVTAVGTNGQVLTGVTGADPAWAAPAASSISITGDTGGAQTGDAFTFNGGTTGLSFGGAADVFTTTFAGITANGGTVSLATDATASTINIGTGGGVKTVTLGSQASTSSTVIQGGSGTSQYLTINGNMSIYTGTGQITISADPTATSVQIATGGGAKTVQLGSTNSTSTLGLRYGTSGFTLASATGTVMNALDTGEITYPLQPAFLVVNSGTISDVTGDGTPYTVVYDTEIFDQNSDFSSTTFTAPVTGRYQFNFTISLGGILVANSILSAAFITSNRNYSFLNINPFPITNSGNYSTSCSVLADMDAGDTCSSRVNSAGGTKVVDVISGGTTDPRTSFSGFLSC